MLDVAKKCKTSALKTWNLPLMILPPVSNIQCDLGVNVMITIWGDFLTNFQQKIGVFLKF
jgi:hypothetical protein